MSGSAVLSPNDLLQIARDPSVASRRSLALSVTALFEAETVTLAERERTLAGEILGGLIRAFELEIRCELAARLAPNPRIPRAVIVMLANDQIEVARPILLNSDVLEAEDLIEIIELRGLNHQLAVACRETLCEDVCEALVETRNPAVIETVLRNPGAESEDATLTYLIEQARDVAGYQEALALRDGLTPRMVRRLYALVSDAVKQHILENYDVRPADLEDEPEPEIAGPSDELQQAIAAHTSSVGTTLDATADARHAAPDDVAADDPLPDIEESLVHAMLEPDDAAPAEPGDDAVAAQAAQDARPQPDAETGAYPVAVAARPEPEDEDRDDPASTDAAPAAEDDAVNGQVAAAATPEVPAQRAAVQDVTPELLIKLLRQERFDLFEERFGRLSGLESVRLKDVIYGAEGRDLAITCRALNMAKTDFAVILFLTRKGSGKEVEDPREIAKVMHLFESTQPEAAMDKLKLWRRSNGFIKAAKALGRAYDDRTLD